MMYQGWYVLTQYDEIGLILDYALAVGLALFYLLDSYTSQGLDIDTHKIARKDSFKL